MCLNYLNRSLRVQNVPLIILALVLIFLAILEVLPHSVSRPKYISQTLADLSNSKLSNLAQQMNLMSSNYNPANHHVIQSNSQKAGILSSSRPSNETLKQALEALIVYAAEYNQEDNVADLIAAMLQEVDTEGKNEIEKEAVQQILQDEQETPNFGLKPQQSSAGGMSLTERMGLASQPQNPGASQQKEAMQPKLSDLNSIVQSSNPEKLNQLREEQLDEEDETDDLTGLPSFNLQDTSKISSPEIVSKVDSLLNIASSPVGDSSKYNPSAYMPEPAQQPQEKSFVSKTGEVRFKGDTSNVNIKFHSEKGQDSIGVHSDPFHKHKFSEQFSIENMNSAANSAQNKLQNSRPNNRDKEDKFDQSQLSSEQSKLFLGKVNRVVQKKSELMKNSRVMQAKLETDDYYYPKMIMVGVKKCGTGALARFLGMHPLVKYAGEQYYFNRYYTNSLVWYLHQMPKSRPSEIVFEKTPSYLFSPSVAENIKKFDPNIKIINIMCDPARRIYSDFLHMNRFDKQSGTMENFQAQLLEGLADVQAKQDQVNTGYTTWNDLWHKEDFKFATRGQNSFGKVLLRSCYSIFLKKWYQLFGRADQGGNMLNIDGTRLYSDPGNVLIEVQKFLNLPIALNEDNFYFDQTRGLFCSIDFNGKPKCAGKGKGRSVKSEVPAELKQKMRDMLKPFTEELSRLENQNYDHWTW